MRRIFGLLAAAAAMACVAVAQPRVNNGGVLNAASYALPGLPNAGIAQGSLFVVFGSGLGPASLQQVQAFPLPTQLGGTTIRVTSGGNTRDALMVYTSAGQVAAILPSSVPVGTASLTVNYNGQASTPVNIQVVESAFGMFTLNQAGSGPAVVQNFVSASNLPVNTLTESAQPGQTVVLWGTGLGPVSGDEAAGPLAPAQVSTQVQVLVGGKPANVTYKGRSGCCAGIDQIVFEVPQGVESCYAPVVVMIGGKASNFGSISVSNSGKTCSGGVDLSGVSTGRDLRSGDILLSRSKTSMTMEGQTVNSQTDSGVGSFYRYTAAQLLRAQNIGGQYSTSVRGSCSVVTFAIRDDDPDFEDPIQPAPLNAGPAINVTGPKGTKQLQFQQGAYFGQLGGGISIPGVPNIPGIPGSEPLFLDPGSYRIDNGAGGPDVGAFQATLNIPAALTWTNETSINDVSRAAGVRVTWSGGDPAGYVAITGMSFSSSVAAMFTCLESTSAGQFTVPSYVLQSLPASSGQMPGNLSVSGSTAATTFKAQGLDSGNVLAISATSKTVRYQ